MDANNRLNRGRAEGRPAVPESPGARIRTNPRGFSLIELLVAMVIMVIVASAALVVFRSTAESEARQQENLAQIQNLRAAFYTVARDARMAGNGLLLLGTNRVQIYVHENLRDTDIQENEGWFRYKGDGQYGAGPVYGTDSGSDMNKADTLTIFRSDLEAFSHMASLGQDFTPGASSQIVLENSLTEGVDYSDGDIIAVSDGAVAVILQARVNPSNNKILLIGERFRPTETMKSPANYAFGPGARIYNLKNVAFVTYSLDTANLNLMANYHDRIENEDGTFTDNKAVVATNIEDFQVQYYDQPNGVFTPTLADATIPSVAVRLGMVSRSSTRLFSSDNAGKPIEVLGHTASTESGYTRRVLVENVQLRNFKID